MHRGDGAAQKAAGGDEDTAEVTHFPSPLLDVRRQRAGLYAAASDASNNSSAGVWLPDGRGTRMRVR